MGTDGTKIDAVSPRGECEFVGEVAQWIPMAVIGDMLGMPREHHAELLRWSDELLGGGEVALIEDDGERRARQASVAIEYWGFARSVIEDRKKSPRDDLANFRRKVDAGADSAITQYFYNDEAYWRFVDDARAAGVHVPIVPGIMPIASATGLARFSDNCGAEIPRWIRRRLESYGDDAKSIRAFGLDVVTALCERLIARGAPGLHFYTLNQAALTVEIVQRLGLARTAATPSTSPRALSACASRT